MPRMIYLSDGTAWPVFDSERETLSRILLEYLGSDAERAFQSAIKFNPDVDCQDCGTYDRLKMAEAQIRSLKCELDDAYQEIKRIAGRDAARDAKTSDRNKPRGIQYETIPDGPTRFPTA